jgi:hypothetical protein
MRPSHAQYSDYGSPKIKVDSGQLPSLLVAMIRLKFLCFLRSVLRILCLPCPSSLGRSIQKREDKISDILCYVLEQNGFWLGAKQALFDTPRRSYQPSGVPSYRSDKNNDDFSVDPSVAPNHEQKNSLADITNGAPDGSDQALPVSGDSKRQSLGPPVIPSPVILPALNLNGGENDDSSIVPPKPARLSGISYVSESNYSVATGKSKAKFSKQLSECSIPPVPPIALRYAQLIPERPYSYCLSQQPSTPNLSNVRFPNFGDGASSTHTTAASLTYNSSVESIPNFQGTFLAGPNINWNSLSTTAPVAKDTPRRGRPFSEPPSSLGLSTPPRSPLFRNSPSTAVPAGRLYTPNSAVSDTAESPFESLFGRSSTVTSPLSSDPPSSFYRLPPPVLGENPYSLADIYETISQKETGQGHQRRGYIGRTDLAGAETR